MRRATKALVVTSTLIGMLLTGLWLALAVTSRVYDEPIVLHFNRFGERNIEIVVLSVIVVLMAYSVYKIHQRYRVN
jgi:hypothetical protein